jgi:phosphate transport system substrate-binding protein
MKTAWLKALVLLFTFTLVAAACGDDESDTEAEGDDTEESTDDTEAEEEEGSADDAEADEEEGDDGDAGGALSGDIVISGSSTVEPISVAVAEDYKTVQPDVNVSVSGPGTGDGFKEFCAGNTDISDASRQIKDEEAADCESAGIEWVELKVGVDGIAVMTSEDNADVSCLSFPDLYGLVGPESTGFTNWSDANDLVTEIGGDGGLPEAELVIAAPGTESGTYDSFIEIALEDIAEERGQEATTRPDYTSAADDNVIIEQITTNPSSFGWVGFAYAIESEGVKLLEVSEEPGGDCVEPTPETIASNDYPISRDLFIYVNTAKAEENPAVADFIAHYLDFGLDTAVTDVGYVALTDEAKAETRSNWEG